MPELPEVETTLRGITPFIEGKRITAAVVRERRLRQPVPRTLNALVSGQRVNRVERRAKYLLLRMNQGTLLIHLGMSGNLRVLRQALPPEKHDHVDLLFGKQLRLRFRDPRRFGLIIWIKGDDPHQHPLLAHLGPEPLSEEFDSGFLHQKSRRRKQSIKTFLMDHRIVVGVGNIYANEALYLSGIRPTTAAGKISHSRYMKLTTAIKQVLQQAIEQGGTTLRDFVDSQGKQGYFQLQLNVYGREGGQCPSCHSIIKRIVLGQRSTFYCPRCQK